MQPWPYPQIFAHRLGGALAPENTLTGLRRAAKAGVSAVECDVKLSADGIPFLLHDDTLERTTTGTGPAGARTIAQLKALDAGVRHHRAYRGEALPTLSELAELARQLGVAVNLELKPNPGQDEETGRIVALAARELWRDATPLPLLSSFSTAALRAARQAAPELPRALLVETLPLDYLRDLNACAAAALHADYRTLNRDNVATLHGQGFRVMAYTVNDTLKARTLLHLGVDMICSDRPDQIIGLMPAL